MGVGKCIAGRGGAAGQSCAAALELLSKLRCTVRDVWGGVDRRC